MPVISGAESVISAFKLIYLLFLKLLIIFLAATLLFCFGNRFAIYLEKRSKVCKTVPSANCGSGLMKETLKVSVPTSTQV